MQLYDTEIRNDVLYLETDDGEIGSMADICELVGGDTYTLQYDDRQRHVDWLDTDEEGTLTFDGRDVLAEMSYDREFVATVASVAIDRTDDEGYPLRTSVFADLMTRTWDAKGRTPRATSGARNSRGHRCRRRWRDREVVAHYPELQTRRRFRSDRRRPHLERYDGKR